MRRRIFLAAPAVALLPRQSWACPLSNDWRSEVSELRYSYAREPDEENPRHWLELGVSILHVPLLFETLVRAVDHGQVEFGTSCCDREVALLKAHLGRRLIWAKHNGFVLRSLPRPMRDDLLDFFNLA